MSAAPPTVRPARAGDLSAVEELLHKVDLPTAGVAEALPDFVVAESAGTLLGVAGLEVRGGAGLLRSVAVLPDGRSRGVGRALVEQSIADAARRGVTDLYLLTTTAEDYFPRFGFERITRDAVPEPILATDEFRSLCPALAVAMHRSLASGGQR